jgi:hypothetical protein
MESIDDYFTFEKLKKWSGFITSIKQFFKDKIKFLGYGSMPSWVMLKDGEWKHSMGFILCMFANDQYLNFVESKLSEVEYLEFLTLYELKKLARFQDREYCQKWENIFIECSIRPEYFIKGNFDYDKRECLKMYDPCFYDGTYRVFLARMRIVGDNTEFDEDAPGRKFQID